MQSSYSLLFVELGLSFHLLWEPYTRSERLATHLWMKMLWEKLSYFNVKGVVANLNQTFLRNGDLIMQVLTCSGFSNEMLLRLNQVRVCQQLLFMSDIFMVSGNKNQPRSAITPNPRRGMVKYDVAYRAPYGFRFPNVEEGHSFHLPKSKQLYTCWTIHGTNPQDLAMDMEWQEFNPASPQGRWHHGGCFHFGEEAKQIPPLTQPTQQPSQYNLLGPIHSGWGRLVSDILSTARETQTGPYILPWRPPIKGKNLAMGASYGDRGRILAA
jgi:hypothetical protein